MKDRINELMKTVGKTPTDFANTIEISPAVLSSIKSGRTKPTLFLVEKIKSVYPNINVNWLITGEGEMFIEREQQLKIEPTEKKHAVPEKYTEINKENNNQQDNIQMLEEPDVVMKVENVQMKDANKQQQEPESWQVKTVIKPDNRKISQIIVLYDDGTFETLTK